jgi:HEAT repeat protein
VATPTSVEDREDMQGSVQALAAQLRHGDLAARRSALDTLEALGPDAAPAAAELVAALRDRDKFVRWAAARTLGKFGPAAGEIVALQLAQLLTDGDLDVRLAAAAALERLGPAAQPATADLCRTVGSTDAELRLAALRALGTIGDPDVQEAVAQVALALRDSDGRVRMLAAQVLGKFGPAARQTVAALGQALQDPSPDVQKAAGEALLTILRPGQQ